MNNENNLKFLFVGVMVAVALVGRTDRDNQKKTSVQENIQNTSLAAEIQPKFQELNPKLSAAGIRKNWDVSAPVLKVKAALVKDLDFDYDFYRLNTNDRWALASLTKLMTSVTALEASPAEGLAPISESAVETEGAAGNLEIGERYSISDLVKAMMLVSSNDAAAALAEFYGGEKFIAEMQLKAFSLGMEQTIFTDPSGISFLNQGSIEDLEKLVSYIYKNHPVILEISRQKSGFIMETAKNIKKELLNINAFAGRPDFYGGKTGFTEQAGGNLASIFDYRGHKILIIVLGTDDRFGQTELLYNWVKEAYSF